MADLEFLVGEFIDSLWQDDVSFGYATMLLSAMR